MLENNLSDVEVLRWFETCGLEDVRVIEPPILPQAPRLLTSDSEPHPDAEVPQCAE